MRVPFHVMPYRLEGDDFPLQDELALDAAARKLRGPQIELPDRDDVLVGNRDEQTSGALSPSSRPRTRGLCEPPHEGERIEGPHDACVEPATPADRRSSQHGMESHAMLAERDVCLLHDPGVEYSRGA
jgi:hypothetical protein